ncbi:MAG TPA: GNAT family N-acetyltransferase [Alphaproteobacteria bacterium]|nr:GNAT family N-acetyltransferase [Alphaproteobacteria bacterium]
MSTPSSPASSSSLPQQASSLSIADAFAYCRAHPVEGVDLERVLGIFTSGPACIVDAREHGLLGIVMDRLRVADGAKPFEWIGGPAEKIAAEIAPVLLRRIVDAARSLGLPAIDVTLQGHWSAVRDQLAAAGARPRYVDVEMTRPEGAFAAPAPLPEGWRWAAVMPDHEPAYYDLLVRSLGLMPGVYIPPEAEAIASMRTTADGTRVLLDNAGRARALVRCKIGKRYIHLLARCPEMRGRGLGALALDEAARLLGPGPLHLTVVEQNRVAHDFYLRNGFAATEEIETWQLPIAA